MKILILLCTITLFPHAFAEKAQIEEIYTPSSQMYFFNETLEFSIVFNEDVVISGKPSLVIELDSGKVEAEYIGGSGHRVITFQYTVRAGDFDFNGINIENRVNTNWGEISTAGGSSLDLSLSRALRRVSLENILVKGY